MDLEIKPPCFCPICEWTGYSWGDVLATPTRWVKKACRRCGSYPRDRVIYALLTHCVPKRPLKTISVIEVGASCRSYWWKKRLFQYWNGDISNPSESVDFQVNNGLIDRAPSSAQVAILSFVLSMVRNPSERLSLLTELHRLTDSTGRLIVFDDLGLRRKTTPVVRRAFFHEVRLGTDLLAELSKAGWFPVVITAGQDSIGTQLDSPFILADKKGQRTKLTEWGTHSVLHLSTPPVPLPAQSVLHMRRLEAQ